MGSNFYAAQQQNMWKSLIEYSCEDMLSSANPFVVMQRILAKESMKKHRQERFKKDILKINHCALYLELDYVAHKLPFYCTRVCSHVRKGVDINAQIREYEPPLKLLLKAYNDAIKFSDNKKYFFKDDPHNPIIGLMDFLVQHGAKVKREMFFDEEVIRLLTHKNLDQQAAQVLAILTKGGLSNYCWPTKGSPPSLIQYAAAYNKPECLKVLFDAEKQHYLARACVIL